MHFISTFSVRVYVPVGIIMEFFRIGRIFNINPVSVVIKNRVILDTVELKGYGGKICFRTNLAKLQQCTVG